MPALPDATSLRCLLEDDQFLFGGTFAGDGTWRDWDGAVASNFSNTASGASTPVTDQGPPISLLFDGGDFLNGPNWSTMITAAAGTMIVVFKTSTSGVTQILLGGSASNSAPALRIIAGDTLQAFNNDGANQTNATGVIEVNKWHIGWWGHGGGRLYCGLDSPFGRLIAAAGVVSGNSAVLTGSHMGQAVTTNNFSGNIAAVAIFNTLLSEDDLAAWFHYFKEKYLNDGSLSQVVSPSRTDTVELARDALSKKIVLFNRPRPQVEFDLPMWFLDRGLGTTVGLSSRQLPTAGGVGAAADYWRALPVRIEGLKFDPEKSGLPLRATGRILRVRHHHSLMEHYARPISPRQSSRKGDGILRSGPSNAKTYMTRNLTAWVEDSSGIVRKVLASELKTDAYGGLFETSHGQINPRPAFVSAAGYTLTNPTGGSVAYVTAGGAEGRYFDPTISTRCLKFIRGSAGGAPGGRARIALLACAETSAMACFVIDTLAAGSSSAGFIWRLQRSSDSKFWKDTLPGWITGDGSSEDNYFDTQTPPKYTSAPIDLSTAVGTLTLDIIQHTTAINPAWTTGDVRHVYYAGVHGMGANDSYAYRHSPIVVDNPAAETYSGSDGRIISCVDGVLNVSRGTALIRFRVPNVTFQGGVVGVETNLLYLYDPATAVAFPVIQLTYFDDGTTKKVRAYANVAGGPDASAVMPGGWVAGQEYVAAFRWTKAGGEFGLPANSIEVFAVNLTTGGTASTLSSGSAFMSGTIFPAVYVCDSQVDFEVRAIELSPDVLHADEIFAWGR